MHRLPLFASKPTLARIDFLRLGERLVDRKGTQNVKILAKNQTNRLSGRLKVKAVSLCVYLLAGV